MRQKPIGNVARKNWNNRWRSSIKRKIRCTDPARLWKSIISLSGLPGQPFDWESPNMLRWIAWVKQQEASLKTSPFLFQWQSCWTLYYELPFILAFTKIKTVKSSSVGFKGPMRAKRVFVCQNKKLMEHIRELEAEIDQLQSQLEDTGNSATWKRGMVKYCSNYSDLSWGHPQWWFSKRIGPKSP